MRWLKLFARRLMLARLCRRPLGMAIVIAWVTLGPARPQASACGCGGPEWGVQPSVEDLVHGADSVLLVEWKERTLEFPRSSTGIIAFGIIQTDSWKVLHVYKGTAIDTNTRGVLLPDCESLWYRSGPTPRQGDHVILMLGHEVPEAFLPTDRQIEVARLVANEHPSRLSPPDRLSPRWRPADPGFFSFLEEVAVRDFLGPDWDGR